ncbi:hypothetical protein yc1106_03713 [Curvularia clavata]|uniref:Uncharacterized protein n=1 Tax=Curvularia clavata TaxID=95742 RepID=A0A9Q8Z5L8_CURCL|nr:hypothetical protein yc1106_03713 [Curvularia clavata]
MDSGKYLQPARSVGTSLASGRGVPYWTMVTRDRDVLHSVGVTYLSTYWSCVNKHNRGIMDTRKIVRKRTFYAEKQ